MSENNPYAAPDANLENMTSPQNFRVTGPRSVGVGRGWGWIAEGFGYFKKSPGAWILTVIIGFVIMIVMSIIPVVGQLALMLTTYVWMGGIMIGCHTQARGGAFEVKHLFAGFNKPGKLILVSVLASVVSMVIMLIAVGPVYLQMLKGGVETSPDVNAALMDPTGFWLPMLFGMLLLIPMMMAVWFAPALIALNDAPVLAALKLSFMGCLKNILPFLVYGIIAFVLYILGAIPLALGLLVVGPMLFASIYVSYREIFIEEQGA